MTNRRGSVRIYDPICAIDDCDKPSRKRGWCAMHYKRWQIRGTTDLSTVGAERDTRPPMERIDKAGPGGCWLWTGGVKDSGYGYLRVGKQSRRAHRWVYEQLVGPIPHGLQLDHLCRVRHCVNPMHLEPVTGAENIRRAIAARKAS